jgi:hypothetical protein
VSTRSERIIASLERRESAIREGVGSSSNHTRALVSPPRMPRMTPTSARGTCA